MKDVRLCIMNITTQKAHSVSICIFSGEIKALKHTSGVENYHLVACTTVSWNNSTN